MTRADLTAIGSTGLTHFDGRVYEEYLRELQGDRWRRTLREMIDQDPVIGAVLFAVEMLIRQVAWEVHAGADDSASQEAAALVRSALHDMETTWPDTLSEILSFLPWGWSYFEILYKTRNGESTDPTQHSTATDGRIGWRGWSIRSQDTLDGWDFDDHGTVRGLYQIAPPRYVRTLVPSEKALHFRTTSRKGNPEGRSILRNAYRPWYFKKHIEGIEGIGIERDLAGLPVAWVPEQLLAVDRTADEAAVYEAIRQIVTNIRRDEQEGIIFPLAYDGSGNKVYDLTLLSSGGGRQFNTDRIVQRYDAKIAMTVMADFLLLGHEKVGSFALASSKTDLFSVALGAWLDTICAVINSQAIPRLVRLNGMQRGALPVLTHSDVETVDLAELGAYISALTGAGMTLFPNEALETHLLKQAGLPVVDTQKDP